MEKVISSSIYVSNSLSDFYFVCFPFFRSGQTYFSKYRFVMNAGMLAGLVAVLAVPSILRVLSCTRQSSTAFTAYRRYVRTIFHTQAWYNFNIADRGSRFWTSIAAVRKAHSRSSHACARRGAGQITQKDLALTQFGFIGFITMGAHRIKLNDQDFLEATTHMWRVLGHLLGIKEEYNICGKNWAESKLRLDIVMRKVYEPALANTGDDFYQMTEALINGLWHMNTMFVEDQDIARRRLGGDHTGILGHVARPVDLALVVDLDLDLDFATHRTKAAELALFVVIVRSIELRILAGQLDAGNEEVVLLVGCVCAQDEAVHRVVLAVLLGHVRQPLGGQRGPLEGVRHDQVVQERRVLLPNLVLLVDHALLNGVVEGFRC